MPFNCLGMLVGDTDADSAVGPPPIGVDGAIQAESGPYLNTEDGNILAFD